MFDAILQTEVQRFIRENLNSDTSRLLLKGGHIASVPMQEVVEQIISYCKAKAKVPFLLVENIVFPPKISMEQCSSEITAKYKTKLISGKQGVDLTGGAGIDAYFFSMQFEQFDYVEQNEKLAQLTAHNFEVLEVKNIQTYNTTAEAYVATNKHNIDFIFLDPARRDEHQNKVFLFSDCKPNIVELKNQLLANSETVMVKASPLVDVKQGVAELGSVSEIHVVAVNNECKELLFILKPDAGARSPNITCVNYKNDMWESFEFQLDSEIESNVDYALPKHYLYEPNVAILKAGAFKSIAAKLKIEKLHPNSHLYTSDELVPAFPGRTFEIEHVLKYDKKALTKVLPEKKANITCRNFPETVQQIRKKTGLKDGGQHYLFATTNMEGKKVILLCKSA